MRHDVDLAQQASPARLLEQKRLQRARAWHRGLSRPVFILALVVGAVAIAAVPGRALLALVTGS